MLRLALAIALLGCALAWQNNWDRPHRLECGSGQYITRIQSYHHNHYEDRRWHASCSRAAGVRADKSCRWSGWVNGWDAMLSFTCGAGQVITGMNSYHDNGREDRRFQFKCCSVYSERRVCPNKTFGANCQFRCACDKGAVCNKVTGSCPNNKCVRGRYGANCQLVDSCYYNGKRHTYLGGRATTKSGKTCQAWSSMTPHAHTYSQGCDFTDKFLPKNLCRVSVYDAKKYNPWCYTTDKSKRWEECAVKSCACPRGTYGENCEKECHCMYNDQCLSNGACRRGCAYGWAGNDCQARIDAAPSHCQMTGYANNWDASMNYGLGSGWAFSGAFSFHDNGREDRRWRFMICRVDIRA